MDISTEQELIQLREQNEQLARSLREECSSHSNTIDGRDRAQNAADSLANAIASHFQADIGEHSNLNCPWENALECIENSEAQRWIPVSERLPEDGVRALVLAMPYLCGGRNPINICERTQYEEDGRTWHLWEFGGVGREHYPDEYVTHWMPLPAAPQEISNEHAI